MRPTVSVGDVSGSCVIISFNNVWDKLPWGITKKNEILC